MPLDNRFPAGLGGGDGQGLHPLGAERAPTGQHRLIPYGLDKGS